MATAVASYPVQQTGFVQQPQGWLAKCKNTDYVDVFTRLESEESEDVQVVEETLKELDRNAFHQVVLDSLPIWPVDADAIAEIIKVGSASKHPLVRQRALMACAYLVTTQGAGIGYGMAAQLAALKMRSEDAAIQKEGLDYFQIVLRQWQPDLVKDDLTLAIGIARRIFLSPQWVEASSFFDFLLEHGKADDCLAMKSALLEFCANRDCPYSIAFKICDKIICNPKSDTLISIPLEAAKAACASEDSGFRDQGLNLYWRLLSWYPAECIDDLLEALVLESKRERPCIGLLSRLEEVAGHKFSNLFHKARGVITDRAVKDAPVLLEILTTLSKSDNSYYAQQAATWKPLVEARLKESAAV